MKFSHDHSVIEYKQLAEKLQSVLSFVSDDSLLFNILLLSC